MTLHLYKWAVPYNRHMRKNIRMHVYTCAHSLVKKIVKLTLFFDLDKSLLRQK